jgi:hypothetical protein
MTVGNAIKGEIVNRFKCLNPDGRDAWASTWVEIQEDENYSPESAEKYRKQAEKEERRHQAFLKSGLSRSERDKNFRLLSRHCGLSKGHQQNLKNRGLSDEEIASGYFFSATPNQFIPRGINPRTPGVGFGNKLSLGQSSLACPAFDNEGRIIGYQLRLDEAAQSKYRWAKGQYPSHLQNGELPITVARPVDGKPIGVAMSEGILKAFVAAQIHQKIFLGASGANFSSSPEQLKLYLEAVTKEVGLKVIDFYPDAGSVSNTHVVRSYRKTFDLLERLGCQIRVVWWEQPKKQDRDCDEISSEQAISYLSRQEFEDICIQHGGFIPLVEEPSREPTEEELEAQRKEEFYRKVVAAQRPLRTLSYKSDIVCPREQKYLPDLVGKVPESGILLFRAPKGSGKSHQIKAIKDYLCGGWVQTNDPDVREYLEVRGKRFFSVTPRIALGREQAIRWQYSWVDDISPKATFLEEGEHQLVRDVGEVGCCFDSLWKFAERDFSNTLMVVDECELGLAHMAASSTLKRNRPLVLKLFEEKVRECLENNGLLILSDADLSDISVDYIRSICPNAPVFLVDYQGCPNPWEVEFFTGYQDDLEKQILDWFDPENILDEDDSIEYGQPIYVATDSQDEAEALEKQLIKRYPELAEKVGGVIRIDSTTTQTDFGREFVKYPNKSIKELKPKVLIATPSLGVGVSLDVPWFKRVFGLFFGAVEPSQARQQLARVRQPVPRTVWAKEKGNLDYGIMGSFFPEEIKSNLFQHHESTSDLIGIALELAKDNVENQCDAAILPALIKTLQGMMETRGSWNNKHVDLRCKIQARRNFSLSQLALQLRQELIEEGHLVIDCGCPEKNGAGEDVREQKEQDKVDEAKAIATAPDIDIEAAKQKLLKPTSTLAERNQIQKSFLKEELPGIELTPEFVHKAVTSDRAKWKNSIKFYWHCQRLEATKSKDLSEWRYKLKLFESGLPFLPDIKTQSLQCKVVIESGLLEFLSEERLQEEYISESPQLRSFWAWAQKNQSLLKRAFGMSIGNNPVSLLNRLLIKIGLKLQQSRSEKLPNGSKLRFYKVAADALTDPDRHAILAALDLRWKLQQEEKAKKEQAWLELVELSNQEAAKPTTIISQSQEGLESWGQTHPIYKIQGECDTEHIRCQEGVTRQTTEELAIALSLCESPADFAAVIERVDAEAVADAIALQDSQPRRQQLTQWFEQESPAELGSGEKQENPARLAIGMRVRVNIQKASCPQVRELRAEAHGVVGTIQVIDTHSDLYTVLCEDGKTCYYESEYLEVIERGSSADRPDRFQANPQQIEEADSVESIRSAIYRIWIQAGVDRCDSLPEKGAKYWGAVDLIRPMIHRLTPRDQARTWDYWRELWTEVWDGGKRPDRGSIQVGDVVRFLNPSQLEASRIYEDVLMKIKRVVGGQLAFCELPDGSEETFAVHTLAPA